MENIFREYWLYAKFCLDFEGTAPLCNSFAFCEHVKRVKSTCALLLKSKKRLKGCGTKFFNNIFNPKNIRLSFLASSAFPALKDVYGRAEKDAVPSLFALYFSDIPNLEYLQLFVRVCGLYGCPACFKFSSLDLKHL
jgi:hypothetical protein